MIYIFTALYCEAQIFIRQYHLKKAAGQTRFQQFADENGQMRLTVTGAGEIAAAAAVSSVLTQHAPGEGDFLLNAGICAGITQKEGIFLAHKLAAQASGKTFYPDMLFRHEFEEASLLTGSRPWTGGPEPGTLETDLYDMEAAAVYQAGAYFLAPHQMLFLKAVSDCGEGTRMSAEIAAQCMERHAGEIFRLAGQLVRIGRSFGWKDEKSLQREEAVQRWCQRLCAALHCSRTMEHELRQHLRYAELAGIDYESIIGELCKENKIPCRDKREGKRCFEAFRQRLFSAVFFTHLCGKKGGGPSTDEGDSCKIPIRSRD